MQEPDNLSKDICSNCGAKLEKDVRFCNYCGFSQVLGNDTRINSLKILTRMLLFFGALTITSLIGNFSNSTGIDFLLVIDVLFIMIVTIGVGIYWTEVKPLLKWKGFRFSKAILFCLLSIVFAIVVNLIVTWINKSMFGVESYYYYAFEHLKYAKLVTILFIAVQPAIFEELAFRGIIQSNLNQIIDSQQAIYLTAFLFAIIHMSFISLFWLLPFAILLSYVRNRENTIWYGILMHFFFNATACFLEFFKLEIL